MHPKDKYWNLWSLYQEVVTKGQGVVIGFSIILFLLVSAMLVTIKAHLGPTLVLTYLIEGVYIIYVGATLSFILLVLCRMGQDKKVLSVFLIREFGLSESEDPIIKSESILEEMREKYLDLLKQKLSKQNIDCDWNLYGEWILITNRSIDEGTPCRPFLLVVDTLKSVNTDFETKMPFTPEKINLLGKTMRIRLDRDSFNWEM